MVSDRPMYRQVACQLVVLGTCTLSFDQSAKAASSADGHWVVEERCGEFKAAKDPAAQKGFNWEIDIVVENGRVTGSKHSVNPTNSAVTDVTYQGSIRGSDIVITGTGKRSNLDTPWTYTYAGKIDPDGRAKLTGPMSMKFGNSQKPTPIRECNLSFLAPKVGQLPPMIFARSLEDMQKIKNGLVAEYATDCDGAAAALKSKDPNASVPDNRTCIINKLRDGVAVAVAAPVPSAPKLQLTEFAPALIKPNTGPTSAKGVIYYVDGYGKHEDDHRFVPYYLKSLTDDGWDLIAARVPSAATAEAWEADSYQVAGGVAFVQGRLKEIKALGYKRVVLAGFSWGGWVSLVASQIPDLPVDMLLINAPALFGHRIFEGKPNAFFDLNLPAYERLISKAKRAGMLIFPEDPVGEPDARLRGAMADRYLTAVNLPHVVIAAPPGFSAHYAAWLPFFDFAYGKCIAAFLDKPTTEPCRLPAIANTDFRSILSLKQIPDAESRRITSSAPLVGRKFAAYVLRDEDFKRYDFISRAERVTLQSQRKFREPIEFHDGQICASKQCRTLIRWSETELLEFESDTGKLKAWWIATQ
jgi:pimeloyl-ACP methyl ester carboxylesterase